MTPKTTAEFIAEARHIHACESYPKIADTLPEALERLEKSEARGNTLQAVLDATGPRNEAWLAELSTLRAESLALRGMIDTLTHTNGVALGERDALRAENVKLAASVTTIFESRYRVMAENAELLEACKDAERWCQCAMETGMQLPCNDVARGAGAFSGALLSTIRAVIKKAEGGK